MKKKIIAAAAVVLALGAGGVRHLRNDTAQAVAPAAPPVAELAVPEVATAAKASLRFTVPLSGTLRPVDQTTVKAQVAAQVAEVLVREGQPVRKGDVLARLDVADLTSKLNERIANLESARAQLALAEKTRQTKLSLQQKGYAAQSAVDEVESSYQAGQASVRAMQAQVDMARKALADAVVTASMDGLVGERAVNPGDKVAVDSKLFTIVDLSRLEIEAPVPTNEIARVTAGLQALFRVPGLEGREFEGHVERINPTTKAGSRSIPVYIRVDNGAQELRGGMFATGDIVVREVADALAVPPSAVRGPPGQSHVLLVDGDRIARRPVELSGEATADLVGIRSGLSAGDRVVSAPAILLEPGTQVRVGGR